MRTVSIPSSISSSVARVFASRRLAAAALVCVASAAANAECSKDALLAAQQGITSYRSTLDAAGQTMTLEVDPRGRVRMSGNVLGTGANLSMIRVDSNMYIQHDGAWKLLPAAVGGDMAKGFEDMSLASFTEQLGDLGPLNPRACPDGSACVASDFEQGGHKGTVYFDAATCRMRHLGSERAETRRENLSYTLDVSYPEITVDVPTSSGKVDMMDLMGLLSGGMSGPGAVPRPPG
ncbi:MAG: hypothetical protein AAF515_09290 [Pseudomonadota bacterium]